MIKKWYSDCYRRNLVDMHIADWSPEFLSEFSADDYYDDLKRAHIGAAMIYLQSHCGLCYFPTRSGRMHAALRGREDLIKRLVDKCNSGGIHTVGYYSLIYNTAEEERHPEWAMRDGSDGLSPHMKGSRYGLCCPNNPGYRAFVEEQITEISEYFTLDGMFYDMLFWPVLCRCPHCLERYRREYGREMPDNPDPADPAWREHIAARARWMGEFARYVTDLTYKLMPGATVEHNYASAVASDSSDCGSTELVNDACDYTGGDLYGDLYNHSFTAKYYYGVTKNQPFEYMTCRCDSTLRVHTVTKSEDSLAVEVMLTAAHHGASFIIDAIDPCGTMDKRVYDRIGRVFERQMPYEKYFRGEMISDVGVWYSTTGRYNGAGQSYTSKTASVGAVRSLIRAHIPVSVVSNSASGSLGRYKAVMAPAIAGISAENREDLIRYVEKGGKLYISGAEEPELLRELIGIDITGYTDESVVYLAPTDAGAAYFGEFSEKYPLPFDFRLPKAVMTGGGDVLAYLKLPYTKRSDSRFASIHSDPPGTATDIPAVIRAKKGKGTVIWSAAPIENDRREPYCRIITAIAGDLIGPGDITVTSDAPRQVELVSFRDGGRVYISAVDLMCTDELIPIREFDIRLRSDKAPVSVMRLGGRDREDSPAEYIWDGSGITIKAGSMTMFDMYKIELA